MNTYEKISSFFDALFIRTRSLKVFGWIERSVRSMGPTTKTLFFVLVVVFSFTSIKMLWQIQEVFTTEIPKFGGSFSEGIVGSPRFINPVLAIGDTDKDLVEIVYSGLLKHDNAGGFEGDLADSFSVSEDGIVYDFHIREGSTFHDGKPVTTDDIVFTIEKVLDPIIKSPKRASWEGVVVEKIDDRNIRFILRRPYSMFNEVATLGILPKHIWQNMTSEEFAFSEFNITPIGSGPYKIKDLKRNSGGIPVNIKLESYNKYTLGRPLIRSITFKFFNNENDLVKAFESGEVDSLGNVSQFIAKRIEESGNKTIASSLPRVFGVFFNQNQSALFLNKEVRDALNISAPRKRIVEEILMGFGKTINGPIPSEISEETKSQEEYITEAKSILENGGWSLNEEGILEKKKGSDTIALHFSLSTSEVPELKRSAEILKEEWEKIGARVDIKVFEISDLNQNVIRPRKYDALLFGEVVGSEGDLYPFWHSSQRNDPGLNVALYANIKTDKLLEEIREASNQEIAKEKRGEVVEEIKKDNPAIFLFSPEFVYVPTPKIKNISLKPVSSPNERFQNIEKFFIETDKVWNIFAQK